MGATDGRQGDFHAVRLEALLEVGPSVFFSLLVIAVAFLPIFTLVDQEGRLFKPLAWTKNLTMFVAAVLALTLDPALRMLFTRMDWVQLPSALAVLALQPGDGGPLLPARRSTPSAGSSSRSTSPPAASSCATRWPRSLAAVLVVASPVPAYLALGHEFMPPARRGHDPLHADDAARHLGHRGEPRCCRCRTGSCSRSPRCERSSARPAAPRPRPTRRRSR